jgi:hypothetical protein
MLPSLVKHKKKPLFGSSLSVTHLVKALCVLNSFLGARFSFSAAALHLVTLATSRSGLRVYQ